MYVDISTLRRNGKNYTRYLLRESFREDGKVKHRTIANLSHCSQEEIEAIRLALRHKNNLANLGVPKKDVQLEQGPSIGALWVVHEVAKKLGIISALGTDRSGKLALWQVIARVIDQGSRLSAVRLAGSHAACDVLGLDKFNENNLYKNLDWLSVEQSKIEDKLSRKRGVSKKNSLFLYDVTSSYLEGENNDLSAFGYNRDGKRGKRQIVIGLLCDSHGYPLSIEAFPGNTQDPKTVASQVQKVAKRFGGDSVTFVGDRGMIKSHQIKDLKDHDFHYITAITKPQIKALLKEGSFQMSLFDETLAEIDAEDGIRYVLRCNPIRAKEISASRESKFQSLQKVVDYQNQYLIDSLRAKATVAVQKIEKMRQKLRITGWVSIEANDRTIKIEKNQDELDEAAKLDGCYVLKTDLTKEIASKEIVHDRYKDLALVEQAFRESKTTHLEMRPIFVQLESRTRGHAFVVMLAYAIIRELASVWEPFNLTVQEGLDQLSMLCMTKVQVKNHTPFHQVPTPRKEIQELLNAAQIRLPQVLPSKGIIVSTKKKLSDQRKKQ
jgi:hypothetical protein